MHLYINEEPGADMGKVIEVMEIKQIIEFVDVPFRFMVLGVINFKKDCAGLFDGFYSLPSS